MEAFIAGKRFVLQEAQPGTLPTVPELAKTIDAASTAAYIQAVMAGDQPVPASIARQVEHILHLVSKL
jgi:hypothetical protein